MPWRRKTREALVMRADVILGYAIYDAEHTTRLSEQPGDLQEVYFRRARALIRALDMRPRAERQALALKIKNPLDD